MIDLSSKHNRLFLCSIILWSKKLLSKSLMSGVVKQRLDALEEADVLTLFQVIHRLFSHKSGLKSRQKT